MNEQAILMLLTKWYQLGIFVSFIVSGIYVLLLNKLSSIRFTSFEGWSFVILMTFSSWIGLLSMLLGSIFILLYHGILILITGTIYLIVQLCIMIYDNFKKIQNERRTRRKNEESVRK